MLQSHNIVPSDLIPLPNYPGYFWHPEGDQLYSVKITGTLTPLKMQPGKQLGYDYYPPRFNVSKNGRKKFVAIEVLRKLKRDGDYVVPFAKGVSYHGKIEG